MSLIYNMPISVILVHISSTYMISTEQQLWKTWERVLSDLY